MKTRWIFWVLAGLILVAAGVLLHPRSPYHLSEWTSMQGQYEGQTKRFWIKALDSDDPETRHKAIFALGTMGADAGEAVPQLATIMLEDEDLIARYQAAFALTKMNPASESAVEPLTRALEDKEMLIRMNAAIALFRLKEKARPASMVLMKTIKDNTNQTNLAAFGITIQEQMILTLGRSTAGTDEAVPVLIEMLKTADTDAMRRVVVRALGFVGTNARPALLLLRPIMKSKDENLRDDATEAIQRIEGNG